MIRFLLGAVANLVLAAIALIVADLVLDDVSVRPLGFVIAVLVFTLAQSLLTPVIFSIARKYASALLGGIGLVSTFLALWVATLLSDGITITGIGWLLAPLIVWIITALGGWIFTSFVIDRHMKKREQQKLVRKASQ